MVPLSVPRVLGTRRVGQILGATLLVSFGLLASFPTVPRARAELSACYSDPVVVLSDGTTIDLSDTIYDSETDVQQVSYVLHSPAGTIVASIALTTGPMGPKESFKYVADQGPDAYTVTTTVTTLTSGISVSASARAVDGTQISTASTTGWNDQRLHLSLGL